MSGWLLLILILLSLLLIICLIGCMFQKSCFSGRFLNYNSNQPRSHKIGIVPKELYRSGAIAFEWRHTAECRRMLRRRVHFNEVSPPSSSVWRRAQTGEQRRLEGRGRRDSKHMYISYGMKFSSFLDLVLNVQINIIIHNLIRFYFAHNDLPTYPIGFFLLTKWGSERQSDD